MDFNTMMTIWAPEVDAAADMDQLLAIGSRYRGMIKDLDEARLRLYWTWKNRRSVRHQLEQVSGRELGIDERYLYKV